MTSPQAGLGRLLDISLAICGVVLLALVLRREFTGLQVARNDRQVIGDTMVSEELWADLVSDPPGEETRQGSPDHPSAQVVVFGDFECPACRQFLLGPVAEVKREHPGALRVIHRHFPLPYHRFAQPAAIATECARQQGRFDEMVTLLYERQDSLGLISFTDFAVRAGVPEPELFGQCLTDPLARSNLVRDSVLASRLPRGVRGTPTVIVNRVLLGGLPDQAELRRSVSHR